MSCEIVIKETKITHLSHEVVCLQMFDFVTSKSNCEVSNSNLWKTTLPQKEPFLMPKIILSNYQ